MFVANKPSGNQAGNPYGAVWDWLKGSMWGPIWNLTWGPCGTTYGIQMGYIWDIYCHP